MIDRAMTPRLLEALRDRPVVLLQGARQSGKSTLVRSLGAGPHRAEYQTLDHAAVLSAALGDPGGFLAGLSGPVILDEVQHAPGLFPAIKASVDADRRPGRFLLTGSANVLLAPKIYESLAGRVEILTLEPLSQDEIEGRASGFVEAVFGRRLKWPAIRGEDWPGLVGRMAVGGYPEVVGLGAEAPRRRWFESYITTILRRDVLEMANIEGLADLPRLLTLLATRATSLLNYADVGRDLSLPQTTLKRYVALLEAAFLVHPLPAWSVNLGKRLVKSPKLLVNDSGLLCHLLGADVRRLAADRQTAGRVLENFVGSELRKQAGWCEPRPRLFHFRTPSNSEVDIVLENAAGEVVGIEVKASAQVTAADWKGMQALEEMAGKRFIRGVVLYCGNEVVPFASHRHAVPLAALWRM